MKTALRDTASILFRMRNQRTSSLRPIKLNATEQLEPRMLLVADPVIAEFQAVNVSTIQDADGDFSDWIELRNQGTESVDLAGWYLTDDQTDLQKWEFPETTLGIGEQMLVFASGKNRINAELHTNFRLSGDGEYLALVQPDGVTIASDFADQYPPQEDDQSYGLAFATNSVALLDETNAVRTLVPSDNSLSDAWRQFDFNDNSWSVGNGTIGFESLRPAFSEVEEFDGPLPDSWTVDLPEGATGSVEVVDGTLQIVVPDAGQSTNSAERGLAPLVYRGIPQGDPTDFEIVVDVQKLNPADRGGSGIVIYDPETQRPALLLEQSVRRTFELTNGSFTFGQTSLRQDGLYSLRMVRDGVAKTWTASAKIEGEDDWQTIAMVTDGLRGAPVIAEPKIGLYASTPVGTIDINFKNFQINVAEQRPAYGPEISVDLGDVMLNKNSSVYARLPFNVEGDASRFDVLTLGARYDDGFKAYLNGTEITAQNAPIASSWNSTAAGVHGAVNSTIPLQRIEIGSPAALRSGENVLAIQGMNVDKDDPDFFLGVSLIASELLTLAERPFSVPSPGEPNLVPSAPAPTLVANQGAFFGSTTIELELEAVSPTLEVRYSLDGNEPTKDSTLYTEPITITESAMFQARTFDSLALPSFEPSAITNGTFIAVDEDLRVQDSDLPIMIIDTLKQGIPGDNSNDLRASNVILFDVNDATGRASLDDGIIEYLGRGGARDRGSSTAGQPKPNMAFETWGPSGSDQNDDFSASLLGLPAESDWILHAPYNFDRAFMRNPIAYEFSNQMGMWAPHTKFVEVYLNRGDDGVVTEGDYAGIYILTEKIKQGPDRVDIAQVDRSDNAEPEVSGGYIWKIDREDPDAPGFAAGRQTLNWVYPKSPLSANASESQKATFEQEEWVKDYIENMNTALDEPDINDPEGYTKYLEVNSWVDQNIVNALMWNVDAFVLSAFLHKDRSGKVAYGPAWDFDRAAESLDERDDNPELWRNFFSANWWNDLRKDPGFWQLYADRYHNWRGNVLSDDNLNTLIDGYAEEVRESADRNFERWESVAPRTSSRYNSGALDGTFQGEVEHFRHWMLARLAFMDNMFVGQAEKRINGERLGDVRGVSVPRGQVIEILSAPLDVFNDTVILSGEPGAVTASYFVPVDNDLGDTWTQPNFDDSGWATGPLGFGYDSGSDYTDLVKTEVFPMNVNDDATNFLARVPFEINDLAAFDNQLLVLRMKFDDGFIGYLNGQEVTRDSLNVDEVEWDTRGGVNRPDRDNEEFEDFDLTAHKDLLVEGTNWLAFKVVNTTASSSDILLLPELLTRRVTVGRNPDATVYFTLDGSDPRMPDGTVNPTAIAAKSGQTISISENTRLISRNFDESDRGLEASIVLTNWSAPLQYDFVVSSNQLAITEINYNPSPPTEAELAAIPNELTSNIDNDSFEFVEIRNPGSTPVDLVGVGFSQGIEFEFTTSGTRTLAAGEYGLLVRNQTAFEARYGQNDRIIGQFQGSLDNNGERIELIDGTGAVLFSVAYGDNDPWPVSANGVGATLELIDHAVNVERQDKFYSWRGSREYLGTPGVAGQGSLGVVINEVIANTDLGVVIPDSIELFNTSNQSIDMSGWYLSDSSDDLLNYQFPNGTTLAAGQYLTFDESDFNDGVGFALSANDGDSVWLTVAENDQVTVFVDDIHFRATDNGVSLGRVPDGRGRLIALQTTSFGATNGNAQASPIEISEINYSPGTPSSAALATDPSLTADDLEFVEIHNSSEDVFDLDDWRLRGGIDFEFTDGTTLNAGSSLIVVKFDPENRENARRLNAFQTHYGITAGVSIVGGYAGQLSNGGDRIELLRPGTSPENRPNFIPRIQADEVLYDDLAPWPTAADGTGSSLQRRDATPHGNTAASWIAGLPNPGSLGDSTRGDFDESGVVDSLDIDLLFQQIRAGEHQPSFDLTGDGLVDLKDRDAMIRNVLGTNFGDSSLDGIFNSNDLVLVFQAGEYDDAIPRNSTWAEGDWDGDGDFGSRDLVLAFQSGAFIAAAVAVELEKNESTLESEPRNSQVQKVLAQDSIELGFRSNSQASGNLERSIIAATVDHSGGGNRYDREPVDESIVRRANQSRTPVELTDYAIESMYH